MLLQTANNEELSVQEWSERFDLRSCIIPPKGKLFLQSDWAQIEVVALATVLDALLQRTSNLTKIINGTVRNPGISFLNSSGVVSEAHSSATMVYLAASAASPWKRVLAAEQ